jgi:scyllo-inositol 2-dehydrogenase (NADP+)
MDLLRVGLVGYGFGSRVFHAPLIRELEGLAITGVFSPSQETRDRAEAELRVPTYPSLEELLDSEADLIVISTPHHTHAELAIQALRAGKHVVVDKVMCLTLEEADSMIAAAREGGRVLSVYQNRRWDGGFLTLRSLLDQGAIGKPLRVEARWLRGGGLSKRAAWRLDRTRGGGMWLDLGAHMVDQLLQIGGAVESVFATQIFSEPDLNVPTHTKCHIEFGSGLQGLVETGALTPFPRPRWVALGTDGGWEKFGLDPQEERLKRGVTGWPDDYDGPHGTLALNEPDGDGVETRETPTEAGDWRAFYINVRDVIRGSAELAVKPEECREALRVLLAAEESAREGQAVSLA